MTKEKNSARVHYLEEDQRQVAGLDELYRVSTQLFIDGSIFIKNKFMFSMWQITIKSTYQSRLKEILGIGTLSV